jgi:hypothetical protein
VGVNRSDTVVEVAQQLGHAPTMTLETYAHVFSEFEPRSRVPAEERIRKAREARDSGRKPGLPGL